MNEYDSAKMADVLNAAHGMVETDEPDEADVILFNTCSVREKAQEKVFHDLGRVKHLKQAQSRPAHRRRRLRRQPGRRGDRRARALCRPGVRPANAAPAAGNDRRAARERRAAGRYLVSGNRKIRPPAAGARRRRHGLRVDHGRLQQVLQLLRRALHARRRSLAAARRRADRSRRTRRSKASRKSRCWGRTSNAYPAEQRMRPRHAPAMRASPISRCCSNTSPKFPASSASATRPRTRRNSPSA